MRRFLVVKTYPLALVHVAARPPARKRAGVMTADACECGTWPMFGRNKAMVVPLEIEDAIAEQVCVVHLLAKAFRHHAQILADDDRAGLLGYLAEDADHLGHGIED